MPKYKIVPGFTAYRAGTDGSIWSRWQIVANGGRGGGFTFKFGQWKKLHPRVEDTGYSGVTLSDGKRRVCMRTHQVIMLAFVGPCPSGLEVLHKNGVHSDCRSCNLRYGTKSENAKDAIKHGRKVVMKGVENPLHKLTDEKVRAIRREYRKGRWGHGFRALGEKYGIGKTVVGEVIAGRRWKHVA